MPQYGRLGERDRQRLGTVGRRSSNWSDGGIEVGAAVAPLSGSVYLFKVYCVAGQLINKVAFWFAGAAGTPTHWQFGFYDRPETGTPSVGVAATYARLAASADQLTTAIAAGYKELAMAAAYKVLWDGYYHAALFEIAATPATLRGVAPNQVPMYLGGHDGFNGGSGPVGCRGDTVVQAIAGTVLPATITADASGAENGKSALVVVGDWNP
ncbi:MAG TPA: hypothetical protein VGJ25_09065 [Gaiellaceae bacterium]|jgi:hypothetical protein